jgi:hypothetical protein
LGSTVGIRCGTRITLGTSSGYGRVIRDESPAFRELRGLIDPLHLGLNTLMRKGLITAGIDATK